MDKRYQTLKFTSAMGTTYILTVDKENHGRLNDWVTDGKNLAQINVLTQNDPEREKHWKVIIAAPKLIGVAEYSYFPVPSDLKDKQIARLKTHIETTKECLENFGLPQYVKDLLQQDIQEHQLTINYLEQLQEEATAWDDRIMMFLKTEMELGISNRKTIERLIWYFKTYFLTSQPHCVFVPETVYSLNEGSKVMCSYNPKINNTPEHPDGIAVGKWENIN